MKENGDIDPEALRKLIEYTSSADYLVAMGTTGESATLDDLEKQEVLALILEYNTQRLPVVFGFGGNDTRAVTGRLKSWKPASGVSAILSVSPYYNKPSQEGIYRHFIAIADHSPVPVLLYNVPGRTGQNMAAETTIRLSAHPNIVGIKEASGNLEQCLRIRRGTPDTFQIISGDDMQTTAIMALGGCGVISVLANAFPHEFRNITDLGGAGDFKNASELLSRFTDINPLLYEEGNPTGIKEVLARLQVAPPFVRLPLAPASETLKSRISVALTDIKKG